METPALIDQSRHMAVVFMRSLQAVKPAIVEESLGDEVSHPLVVVFSCYWVIFVDVVRN